MTPRVDHIYKPFLFQNLSFSTKEKPKATEAHRWSDNQHTQEQHRRTADSQKFVKVSQCCRDQKIEISRESTRISSKRSNLILAHKHYVMPAHPHVL